MTSSYDSRRLHAIALAAALVAFLSACGAADDSPPPPARAAETEPVRLAYDLAVADPVNTLLARWADANPDEPVSSRSDVSTSLAVQTEAGSVDADVLIMSEQTPLPDGENAPIAVRPWTRDPIVLFAASDETRSADEIFESDDRIAIAVEAGPLGQFTRFGFRKLERWEQVKSRVLRFSDESGVIQAVASGEAAMGAVYASALAEAGADLDRLVELAVSDASERSFVVVTLTPEGVELARWLAELDQLEDLAPFGLEPVSTRPGGAR
jgi:ABC-type molybdate transport system substrate-binding protein